MKANNLFLIASFLIGAGLMLFNLHPEIPAGGDSGLYLEQTKALVTNTTDELLSTNKEMLDLSYSQVGPVLYPPGTSIVLALPYYFFGYNNIVFRVINVILYCLAGLLWIKIFRIETVLGRIIFISLFLFNIQLFSLTHSVLSDVLFFFFSTFSIYYIQKSNQLNSTWFIFLAGLIAGYSFLIRSNGLLFVPAYFLLLVIQPNSINIKIRSFSVFLLGFACASLPVLLVYPDSGGSHLSHIDETNLLSLGNQFIYNLGLINRLFYNSLFYALAIPFVLLGLYEHRKKYTFIQIYFVLTILLFTLWPYRNGVRFLLPILPLVGYYFVQGLERLFEKYASKYKIGLLLIPFVFVVLSVRSLYIQNSDLQMTNKHFLPLASFINKEYSGEEFVITKNPRFFRFATGIKALRVFGSDYDFEKFKTYAGPGKLVALESNCKQPTPKEWNLIFEDKYWKLYKFKND